jgi:Protein of unknown function (DUF1822)
MNNVELSSIIVPLQSEDYERARKFATTTNTNNRYRQVYFNTLAVLAVDKFFQWMEIDTDLSTSEIWNPVVRNFRDVADLAIPTLGRLECRPVLPGEIAIHLPPEARDNKIACIAVRLSENSGQAELLGCYTSQEQKELPEIIKIDNLEPLERLLAHFDWLETLLLQGGLNNIRDMLRGLNDKSWEKETFTSLRAVNKSGILSFRGNSLNYISEQEHPENIHSLLEQLSSDDLDIRQKAIIHLSEIGINKPDIISTVIKQLETDLETDDENLPWQAAFCLGEIIPHHPQAGIRLKKMIDVSIADRVMLVITCKPNEDESNSLRVQVYPANSQPYLPKNCKLSILDEAGKLFGEQPQSQEQDEYIQRSFNVEAGDHFSIKVEICNQIYIENFVG